MRLAVTLYAILKIVVRRRHQLQNFVVASKGSGSVTATYDTASKKLSYKGSYSGLIGPATAAHFHGPAEPGNNAAVQIPVFSDATAKSPFEGDATLTDAPAYLMTASGISTSIPRPIRAAKSVAK